jgi:predicted dehydrogenase
MHSKIFANCSFFSRRSLHLESLKVGIVGSGFIARHKHLPAWGKIGRKARVIAVCDVNSSQAEQLARQFGVPSVHTDFDQMLAKESLDIVDICAPPRTHAALSLSALQAGAHVLIEKPMALSTGECDAIIRGAQQAQRKVCVAHSDLFYPSFLRARQMVADGEIGEFRGMHIFLSTPIDYITSRTDHWAHRLPGGVLGETGPHVIYMTLAFIKRIADVRVSARKLLHEFPWSPYEDYRMELMGEKATSTIDLTYATRYWAAQVDLWGSEGLLKVDLETQSVVLHRRSDLRPTTLGFSSMSEAAQVMRSGLHSAVSYLSRRLESTHQRLVRGFVESIIDGKPIPVTAEEGREAVRVMDLMVQKLNSSAG